MATATTTTEVCYEDQLAEQLGPRDMGPAHDSRYNWAAAARKRGISPVHVKDLASRARPTAKAT